MVQYTFRHTCSYAIAYIIGERTKVAKGGKSGAGGSEVYVPKWEFYHALMYMYKGENINDGTSDSLVGIFVCTTFMPAY